jgi:hypothetical protein
MLWCTSKITTECTPVTQMHSDAGVGQSTAGEIIYVPTTKIGNGDASWQNGFAVFVTGCVPRAASTNPFLKRKVNRRIVLGTDASRFFLT